MTHEQAVAERKALLAQLTSLTSSGSLKWERQRNSAHRYARWNNSLLILGPTAWTAIQFLRGDIGAKTISFVMMPPTQCSG